MSTLKAEIVAIDDVVKHPNADRLDIVQVKGWSCVTQKDKFKPGDKCLYIPIDSVLPEPLEAYLFPPDSKITLSKHRVKSTRIRGAVSQGMAVELTNELATLCFTKSPIWLLPIGEDVTSALGITKYEPPEKDLPAGMRANAQKDSLNNPLFHKYTDIENFKNYNRAFEEGEPVSITEKLHGTSARFAKLPTNYAPWWKKVLRFFRLLPQVEFCYGSRNRQLQDRINKKNFYPTDVWGKVAKSLNLSARLQLGEAVYGEIVGDGIQKGYTYGHKNGDVSFFAYDVQINGKYLSPGEFFSWCKDRDIQTVPVLFEGPFSKEYADAMRGGDSTIGGQKVREGIVIKPAREQSSYMGRKVLKHINDEYLLKDQSEFH